MERVEYGNQIIPFSLTRRTRKTLAIEVHPDLSVRVVAPAEASIFDIKEKVLKRALWIKKQQQYFEQFLPRTPEREYVAGETHLYLGRKYLLKVATAPIEEVKMKAGEIRVYSSDKSPENTKRLLGGWYATHAERVYKEVFKSAYGRFSSYSISEPSLEVRRMRNRWGSCTPKGKIILNPELIKVPKKCIEYVLVHEMCHLIERNHSKKFYDLQDKLLPDNKRWKEILERTM